MQNKAELSRTLNNPRTTITSVLRKYQKTGTVETLTRSGKKRSFTNRDRNAVKHLVKSKRRLTLQNITAKLNKCNTKTFSQKSMQRVLHSEGYKVKWCKQRRGRTVDNYWKKVIFQMKIRSCLVQTTMFTFGEKTTKSTLLLHCSRSEWKISLMI